MSEVAADTPEKADSESRCSTPQAASIASLDFDESSKSAERRTRASRSTTPVTKALRPRLKVSESPSSSHHDLDDDDDDDTMDEGPLVEKRKNAAKGELIHDPYCWICHKELTDVNNCKPCYTCLRSFHPKCAPPIKYPSSQANPENWECPECSPFSYEPKPRSEGAQDQLDVLFKYVIDRAVIPATEPFLNPVDMKEFPQYLDYIVHPVCISEIEEKVNKSMYHTPRELLTDFKWIYHNSIIFNSAQAKLTSIAKQMLRVVREETKEIENCPNCLFNAYTMKPDWFIQACDRPHLLVWAKMKGFPYWPAKAMSFNQAQTLVDVRFFGKHDRAYLPIVDCMLYTSWYPAPAQVKKPREDVAACIKEVDQHITKLKDRFGAFVYASNITFLNPKDMEGQVRKMLPNYNPEEVGSQREQSSVSANTSGEKPKQVELSTLKPSVVLTRLPSVESQVSQSSTSSVDLKVKPLIEKSQSNSRKNSTEGDDSQDSTNNLIRVKPASVLMSKPPASASQSPKSPSVKSDDEVKVQNQLKRKLPPSTFGTLKEPIRSNPVTVSTKTTDKTSGSESEKEISSPKKGAANSLAKELEALNSDLSDLDDEVDSIVEPDEEVPVKKSKLEVNLDEDAEMLRHEAEGFDISQNEETTGPKSLFKDKPGKPKANPLKQKKIAEGMKVLDNLKMFGLDVTPVPSASTSPLSPSYAEVSSDSSEFIESDIEMDKDVSAKDEPVVMMEVEPDILFEKKVPTKSAVKPPQRILPKAVRKSPNKISPKSLIKGAPSHAARQMPQNVAAFARKPMQASLLKSSLMPNKARKSFSTTPMQSLLSQRLTSQAPAKKVIPPALQKKQVYVTTSTMSTRDEKSELRVDIKIPSTVPSSAGPATAKLNSLADNLADSIKKSIYTLISDLAKNSDEDLKTENAQLKLQLEAERWYHKTTVEELKRNHDVVTQEFDMLIEESNLRAKLEAQRVVEFELKQTIDEVKRKNWCSVCLSEASLYCCWNTSYCSFPCQKKHWPEHKNACKSKVSPNQPKASEVSSSLPNGPAAAQSTNKVVYTVTAGPANQTNGTMAKNVKKVIQPAMAPHAIFGTSPDVTAALPQLIAVTQAPGISENSEPNFRQATHIIMTPANSNMQVKLPAAIHHTTLPSTITTRTVQTMAKSTTPAVQLSTPLFQFYKEATE